MTKKHKRLLFCFIAIFFLSPVIFSFYGFKINFASAIEVSLPGLPDSPTVVEYAAYFFNIGMLIATSLALLAIAIGGTYYLISFNRGKFTGEGREWVKAGITGLIILLCAYLIAYTINPDLLYFRLPGLSHIRIFNINIRDGVTNPITEIYYQEIPIGKLTETLLSKTMFCYDFDPEGTPIPIPLNTDRDGEVSGPTYRYHDRADCLLKLMDAAQKKAKVISDLSKEIKELMETCKCDGAKCENKTGNFCQLNGGGSKCTKGNFGEQDSCVGEECCSEATKEKIEHGPIKVGGDSSEDEDCPNPEKEYKGLDEFRIELSDISSLIEKKIKVEEEDVAVINIDGRQGIQTPKQWSELKLIEQLMYLKEKILEIQSGIKSDVNKLDSARSDVANCYKIKSSVDFLKLKEGVKPEDKKIIDSKQWQNVDSSEYCEGFNYANSSCYRLCNNMCPDTTPKIIECYNGCIKDRCKIDDEDCFKKQQECIGKCYESRACLFQDPSNDKKADTFKQCISNCREDCSDLCSRRYLLCSEDYKRCLNQCDNNSKCVLENKDTCLINSRITNTADFQNCITQEDYSNIKNCINSSYLCKYGSDEYAGYPDCTNGYTGCAPDTQNLKNDEYSSPYIFDNKDEQRCPNPFEVCEEGKNAGRDCVSIYPETTKCPANSDCPKCPCGEIEEEISFSGTESGESISEEISARDLVAAECNNLTYKKDPLTFYCETSWQQEEYLSGAGFVCSKADEIPVGQAVDDAKKWADELLKNMTLFSDSITNLMDTAKKINDKKPDEYCRCDSKYDNGKPICTSDCQYNPGSTFVDEDGTTVEIPPSCTLIPCDGNPCQQMIDYLEQISKDYEQMRIAFINAYIYLAKEPRTDPLKELSYARQKMSSCGQQMVQFGVDKLNTISCTLAYPGTSFLKESCYGVTQGAVQTPAKDQTDNWFCCRKEKE